MWLLFLEVECAEGRTDIFYEGVFDKLNGALDHLLTVAGISADRVERVSKGAYHVKVEEGWLQIRWVEKLG